MDPIVDTNGALFANDVIQPEQFADMTKSRHRSPEEQLCWAILEDAIACAQLPLEGTSHKCQVARHQAEMWIAGAPTSGFSFAEVCDYLGLDPEVVRERVCQGRVGKLPKYKRTRVKRFNTVSYAL